MLLARVEEYPHKRHTVEKMAAGTLKMTLMIAFRFNKMNTTASKLEKNLCVYAHVPVSGD